MEKIIVAGAGYAGVIATKELTKHGQSVVLINAQPYHQLTTWLHEAAGGRNRVDDYKIELKELFPDRNVQIIVDEIKMLDWKNKLIIGNKDVYPYDYAVVGLGSTPEYFNIEGLNANSLPLNSLESARVIRRQIENEFKKFTKDYDLLHLRVVVCGAGLTGVEFIGELVEWLPVEIICVEAMPDILPMLPNHLRDLAQHELERAGVKFMTNSTIVRVEKQKITLASGDVIHAGTIVWTGGVRAHPLLKESGLSCDRKGRARVQETLQSVNDDRIWIVGDCANLERAGKPLPPTAQLATQMGKLAAINVMRVLQGEKQELFIPKIYGTLASLGHARGVGDVIGVRASGRFAGVFKELTKVKYLWQIGGMRLVKRKRKTNAFQVEGKEDQTGGTFVVFRNSGHPQ